MSIYTAPIDLIKKQLNSVSDMITKSTENGFNNDKESNNILNHIKKDSYIICLDLHGKELSSEEFSKTIEDLSLQTSNISFVIGGSLGLSSDLLKKAHQKICYSKMTFPHQLIRVFLLEQIFREFKISNGETYHR